MSRQLTQSFSLKLIPNTYTNTGTYNFTHQTINNAYTDADDTTSNRMTLQRSNSSTRTSEIYYEFNKSELDNIPSDATIDSITANVKYYVNNTTYVTAVSIQLYSDTTAKGTAVTSRPTNGTKYAITAGTWTLDELKKIRLYISGTHNASNSNGFIYFYGADVTINYSVTITEYQTTITNNASGITVSPTGSNYTVEGENQVITFTNVTDVATLMVLDNNVNVSNVLVNTGTNRYTYTIENISADHTIVLSTVTAYNITASSEIPDIVTISPNSGRAGQGSEYDLDIVTDDINAIRVYDNNVDVTNQLINKIVPSSNTDTVSSIPTQYDAGTLGITNTSYPGTNGLSNSTDTATHARFYCTQTNTLQYADYLFNLSGIPSDAIIDSVTCIVRAYCYNGNNYYSIRRVQLYSGNEAKGNPSSNLNTSAGTVTVTSDDWTIEELENLKLRLECQSSSTSTSYHIRFYGADLTVTYRKLEASNTQYTYTVSNVQGTHTVVIREAPYNQITGSSTFTGVSFTNLPKKIYVSGSNYSVDISGITNPYSYRLSDNNTDVTSSLNIFDGSTPFTPAALVDSEAQSTTNPNNPIGHDSTYTNYAQINLTQGSGADTYAIYSFDLSSIPSTATIKSVSCSVKLLINNTTATYIATRQVQLYCGVTAKGSPYTVANSTAAFNLTCGTWTREELENCYIRMYAKRGTNNTTTNYYFRFYGATLNIEYEDCSYTIQNITAAHTLVLSEAPKYAVTGTSNFSGVTINGTGNVYQGDSITISLSGITDDASFTLYDNNVNVTSSVSGSYQYTISNAQAPHTLRVEENNYVTISGNSTLSGASFSNLPKKVYEPNYGANFIVNITGLSIPNSFILTDNGDVVTNYVDNNQYLVQNIEEEHILVLSEAPYYSVTEGSSTLSGATLTGLTNKTYEGSDVNVEINGVSNPYSIKLLDNGVDVSDKIQIPVHTFTYDVEDSPVASYGFELDSKTGYYVSKNKGIDKSAAVSRVTFNLSSPCTVTINYINYAESTYDFGIFGNVDVALTGDYKAASGNMPDNNYKLACNTTTYNITSVQTIEYEIPSGEHYVDIKFSKDDATSSNNDTLQFKIDSIVPSSNSVAIPKYVISEISTNHMLTVSLQDTVTVTTSSNYTGASLSPVSSTIYEGEPLTLTLTVSDISLISVRVTNSKTKIVTGAFRDNDDGTYTGILTGIRENSTVTVIQKVTYNITCTDNSTYGDIKPTGTRPIDGGYDVEYVIDTDYLNRIYLKDNNVIVNDEIETIEIPTTQATFIPSSYDDVNSQVADTDATNIPANGLTNANSTTRATFTSNTTANSATRIYYNFDCSSIPRNAIIVSITCSFKATCNNTYFNTRVGQLCTGTTKKGSGTTITNTSVNSTVNVQQITDTGTWTREELDDIKILIEAVRGTSTNAFNPSFYGATLTITYYVNYKCYIIENVSEAHTLVLSDRPTYQLTSMSNTENGTITPASATIYENNDAEFIITTSNISKIKLLDNNTDVSDDIIYDDGNFKYIVESVSAVHTLVLKDKLTPYIKINSQFVAFSKIYKKISGSWQEVDEPETIFESNKIYIKHT